MRDQCRCPKCTAANAAASNRVHRERAYGRWAPYVDADQTRGHIRQLRALGIGVDQIAKLAGVSSSTIRSLIHPSRAGKPPIQKVRPVTADRIMAIPAAATSRAPNSHVDAIGTRRRLQALVAIGWTQASLAQELDRSPTNLRRCMTSDRVTARTAQVVKDLYERLWDAEPPDKVAAQRSASLRARAHAAERGWLPPLAWDDIDHDDDPAPGQSFSSAQDYLIDEIAIERAMGGDRSVRLTHPEQIEVVRRMSEGGRSIRTIAETLSTSVRTVSRHRKLSSAA